MTTEQTAQQLELAAQILRTGHPWGYRRIAGSRYKYNTPIEVVADGNTLSPLLATPPEPAFQLPPPPPGMRWHREDGWKADDLPSGYRPLVDGEKWVAGDEILRFAPHGWQIGGTPGDILDEPTHSGTSRCRTTRSLTFEHAGKTWTWHRPGDPMPCDGGREVVALLEDLDIGGMIRAGRFDWSQRDDGEQIIGWRYADEKKTAPLGPEDVPPGSVFAVKDRIANTWHGVLGTYATAVELDTQKGTYTYNELASDCWQINRSIPLTGKWNPDAWEPCSKQIPA